MGKYNNPYDAAKALVAQAYKLWLQKETRTDDVSCVILFLDWPQQPQVQQHQHEQQQQQQQHEGAGQQAKPPGSTAASGASLHIRASTPEAASISAAVAQAL